MKWKLCKKSLVYVLTIALLVMGFSAVPTKIVNADVTTVTTWDELKNALEGGRKVICIDEDEPIIATSDINITLSDNASVWIYSSDGSDVISMDYTNYSIHLNGKGSVKFENIPFTNYSNPCISNDSDNINLIIKGCTFFNGDGDFISGLYQEEYSQQGLAADVNTGEAGGLGHLKGNTTGNSGDAVNISGNHNYAINITGNGTSENANDNGLESPVNEPVTNNTEPVTNNIEPVTSNIEVVTSNIEVETSDIQVINITGNTTVSPVMNGTGNGTDSPIINGTGNGTGNKAVSQINVEVADIVVGETEFINVTLAQDATGYVSIPIGNTNYTVIINDGMGTLSVEDLEEGTYAITANYSGDNKYMPVTNQTSFTVSPRVEPEPEVIPCNTTAQTADGVTTITSVLNSTDILGNLSYWIIDEGAYIWFGPYNSTILNGISTVEIPNLAAGNYFGYANYEGDNYIVNSTFEFEVLQNVETHDVYINNQIVATVEEGETYKLPVSGQFYYELGYVNNGNQNLVYRPGTEITVTEDVYLTGLASVTNEQSQGGASIRMNTGTPGIAFGATAHINGGAPIVSDGFTYGMLITAYDFYTELYGETLNPDTQSIYGGKVLNITFGSEDWLEFNNGVYRAGVLNVTGKNLARKFIAKSYTQINYTDGTSKLICSAKCSKVRSIAGTAKLIQAETEYYNNVLNQSERAAIDIFAAAE